MAIQLTRREGLRYGGFAIGFGVMVGLSGCQTILPSRSNVPIEVHLINNANTGLRPWVQLQGIPDNIGAYLGDGYEMVPGTAEVIELEIEPAGYRLRVVLDREGPPLVEELTWTVSEEECTQKSWIVLSGTDDEIQAALTAQYCD